MKKSLGVVVLLLLVAAALYLFYTPKKPGLPVAAAPPVQIPPNSQVEHSQPQIRLWPPRPPPLMPSRLRRPHRPLPIIPPGAWELSPR